LIIDDYNIRDELDSSSDFLNFEDSYRRRRKEIDILDDRSDGEIGPMIGLGDSMGEIDPNKYKVKSIGEVEPSK
jgi:hypothetical protein